MKKNIFISLFIIASSCYAQQEMTTKTGSITFEASVPLYEEIEAVNKTVFCVLNLQNGQLQSEVRMKDFRFKLSLMEEHFNKKYLETDRFPIGSFTGTIEGFNINIIEKYPKEFELKGVLKIHGKSKKINTTAVIRKVGSQLEIVSIFKINTKDFNIKIPEILRMKVAETVTNQVVFLLQ